MGIKDVVEVYTMQISVQYSSELIMAIALAITTLLLIRYTWNRVKQLPEEERHMGRPLWIASVSVPLLGLASFLNYGYALGYTELETGYYLAAALGGGLLSFTATSILGGRRAQALPFAVLGGMIPLAAMPQIVGAAFGPLSGALVAVLAGILFGIPFVLFSYLTYKTRRVTSFGLAVLSITYPLLLVTTSFTSPEIVAVALAIRVFGPALLITALVLPGMAIRAELVAYSITVSSSFYFMSYLLVSPLVLDMAAMATVSFIAIASILSIGTSAYVLTRWRSSRNPATLTLGLYFVVGGLSYLVVALNHTEFMSGLNAQYFATALALIASMMLNLSSIVALDWKRILLLPILITIAPFWLMLSGWIAQVPPDAVAFRSLSMIISGLLHSIIPITLYGLIWWRMRKVDASGRSRALFLALGGLLHIFGAAGGNTLSIIAAIFIMGAYGVWWLGVTGRADSLLGTAA
ncbi:hypothetical protein EU546_00435 [Candidatus Thorarchaeota archaeon]|nr:MAG: hypothetical protein EU546_00435 [Candidatus Thorarchaeota archaeon]